MSAMAELKRSDFSKICRTCLLQKDNMEPIYKSDIPKMLLSFTNIKALDQYPQNICIDCICEFGRFYTFQQQCIHNFNILENILRKDCKNKQIEMAESLEIEVDIMVKEEQARNELNVNEKVEDLGEFDPENSIDVGISDVSHTESIKNKQIGKKIKDKRRIRKGKPKYSCKECSRTFVTERNYNVHIMNHKQCPECGIYYPTQQKVDRHIRLKHRGEKVYSRICTLCGRQLFSNTAYDYHMRSHTGERPYECDVCHKKFKIISHLNAHRRYHTGLRRHTCQFCSKSYFTNVCLKKHIRSVHTGERPFVCQVCHKSFFQRTNLNSHMKTHQYAQY